MLFLCRSPVCHWWPSTLDHWMYRCVCRRAGAGRWGRVHLFQAPCPIAAILELQKIKNCMVAMTTYDEVLLILSVLEELNASRLTLTAAYCSFVCTYVALCGDVCIAKWCWSRNMCASLCAASEFSLALSAAVLQCDLLWGITWGYRHLSMRTLHAAHFNCKQIYRAMYLWGAYWVHLCCIEWAHCLWSDAQSKVYPLCVQ